MNKSKKISTHILFHFLLLLSINVSYARELNCNETERSKYLAEMLSLDQSPRKEMDRKILAESSKGKVLNFENVKDLMAEIEANDLNNQKNLDDFFVNCGFPKFNYFYNSGLDSIFIIVQHADLAFQLKYFEYLKNLNVNGIIPSRIFALLEDRILIRQGKGQKYGTQFVMNEDGTQKILPVDDPDRLNERRVSIGLTVIPGFP